MHFYILIGNTFNASLQNASPTTFDAGGFNFMQNTINLDISKFHDDIMSGLNIAFGAEYRLENYEIEAGEEASYSQYTARWSRQLHLLHSSLPRIFLELQDQEVPKYFPGFSPNNELIQRTK